MSSTEIQQQQCRNCGSSVELTAQFCEYCNTPLRITTLKTVADLQLPIAQKLAKSFEKDASDENSEYTLALLFLRLGLYSKAQQKIENAIDADPGKDEFYFVQAIALLEGRKPFLCPRSAINQALSCAETAFSLRRLGIYKLLLAIIKYDYFHRKDFLVSPDYESELAIAREVGLARADVQELLNFIKFAPPAEFKI